MKRLLIEIALLALISGCTSSKKAGLMAGEKKLTDVAYGSFPSSKMDVYLPANRNAQTPFVILIHGGAWLWGDKQSDTPTQDSLLAHGIACANINYRFVDTLQTHYPQMLADIDSAVNYCIAHASEWNTRKDKFIISGASAGGHLSLLYGYTTNKKISAIIAECPATDLTDTAVLNYEAKIGLLQAIHKMTNAIYTPGQPLGPEFAASSPIYHVKNIPTLIIHGNGDRTVPYSQSVDLDKKLTAKNIIHKLITIPGADHDLNLKDPATKNMVYKEVVDWAWKYGK
ncbi:alpha/beta hydrolase [Flavihumibacter profundi]|uniref:alpha/beta hydrolase n=1 Tax=Flavihumibacter profundi TaxID=2716883 RepID=UPI001CC5D936|nr:alpha/beta hydrolase [Flavihumibacter profundi]MBZ5856831.1 alpha/beta hydrolase [Flavihumibacter profundi]